MTRADAREWLTSLSTRRRANPNHRDPPLISAQTMKNALHLVRVSFEDAIDARIDPALVDNPFSGMKVRRSRGARTRNAATILRPPAQEIAIGAVLSPEKWMVAFALGSLIRRGEQWALRLTDVHLDAQPRPCIDVRFGAFPDLPTKSGLPRRVYLFGIALDAIRRWLAALPTYAPSNPHGLVFPRRNGEPRKHTPARLIARIRRALGHHFRWHDWRHTGATSLYAGWWGRDWSLKEVQRICGHASVKTTERYVHWLEEQEGQANAVRDTEAKEMVAKLGSKEVEQRGIEPQIADANERRAETDALAAELNRPPHSLGPRIDRGRDVVRELAVPTGFREELLEQTELELLRSENAALKRRLATLGNNERETRAERVALQVQREMTHATDAYLALRIAQLVGAAVVYGETLKRTRGYVDASPQLLWLDLETTGLDPAAGRILEVGAFITRGVPWGDRSTPLSVVLPFDMGGERASEVREMHQKSGLTAECLRALGRGERYWDELARVEASILDSLGSPIDSPETPYLAGASVHFDLAWLRYYMPKLAKRVSYRVYDVSAVVLFCRSIGMPKPEELKCKPHRALADLDSAVFLAKQCAEWLDAVGLSLFRASEVNDG